MPRTGQELHEIVIEAEQPFVSAPKGGKSVRDRMALLREIVDSRYDYTEHLSPMLREQISMPPSLLRFFRNQLVAGLRNDLKLHLEPTGSLKREESAADRMEVTEAHWMIEIDPDGSLRESIHQLQSLGYFWAGWLEQEQWVDPVKAEGESEEDFVKRFKAARAAWFPHTIREYPSDAVAFMEEDRKLTIAVCRYRLPIIDIAERFYGADRRDDAAATRIYDKELAWVRTDRPQAYENQQDIWRHEIEVIKVADAEHISFFVDRGERYWGNNRKARWRELGEGEYENPYGQVPLLLCEGVYLGDRPVGYRRESLLHSLGEIEHAKAISKSHWQSQIASPPWLTEEKLPREITGNDMKAMGPLIDEEGRPARFSTWGEFNLLTRELDATMDKLYGVLSEEGARASPSGLLVDQEGEVKDIAASVQLVSVDERKAMLGSATRSEAAMWGRVLDMIENAYKTTQNSHRKPGAPKDDKDWPYSFYSSGKERVMGKKVERGGQYEVKPQDFDYEYTRSIEPVDDRLSTKAALLDYWGRRRAENACTLDEYYEGIGIEDVSGFKRDKLQEVLVQADTPLVLMEARKRYAEFESIRLGRPIEEIMMETGIDPSFTPEQEAGGAGGVSRFASPQTEGITAGGSESVT